MGARLQTNSEIPSKVNPIPSDMAVLYIADMLGELSKVVKESGLDNLSSLLKATLAASKVNLDDEDLDDPNIEFLD